MDGFFRVPLSIRGALPRIFFAKLVPKVFFGKYLLRFGDSRSVEKLFLGIHSPLGVLPVPVLASEPLQILSWDNQRRLGY